MNSKLSWTQQEDQFLQKIVPKQNRVQWMKILQIFNEKFQNKQRTAKQCRQRYINYSKFYGRPNITAEWLQEQNDNLYKEFLRWGPRWNIIAQSIPQKSGNAIKNRFYGGLRKLVRKMNWFGKIQDKKLKKQIKYQSVIRVIQAPQCIATLEASLKQSCILIRQKIISFIRLNQNSLRQNQVIELINEINQFNLLTRSYKSKRKRPQMQKQGQSNKLKKQESGGNIESQTATNCQKKLDRMTDPTCKLSNRQERKNSINQLFYEQKDQMKDQPFFPFKIPVLLEINQVDISRKDQMAEYIQDLFPQNASPLCQQNLI